MTDTPVEETGEDLCVAQVPLFQGLSHLDQVNVAEVAAPVMVDGGEQILRVLGPGEFIGESAFLTGRRPDHFTTAVEPSSMCVFRHADLGRLVADHPSIALRMLQGVSHRLSQTETRLASVISGDVTTRLAEYLLSLHGQPTEDGVAVQLPMAKKDIASLLDTTPESLSRQLRKLQQSGIAHTQGARGLLIYDIDALMDLAASA